MEEWIEGGLRREKLSFLSPPRARTKRKETTRFGGSEAIERRRRHRSEGGGGGERRGGKRVEAREEATLGRLKNRVANSGGYRVAER